jgi:hypothetical protein
LGRQGGLEVIGLLGLLGYVEHVDLVHVVLVLSVLGDAEEGEVVSCIRSPRAIPLQALVSTVNAVPQVFPCAPWAIGSGRPCPAPLLRAK